MTTPPRTRSRILAVGEVLFDRFPGEKRLGGAPCNFAIHARGLGLDAQLLTRVGADTGGKEILDRLLAFGFNHRFVQIDTHAPTGAVDITFDESGNPAYAILPAAWDHIRIDVNLKARLEEFSPQMLYFGTLVQRTPNGARLIEELTTCFSRCSTLMCDLNLRRGHIVRDRVLRSLEICHILKLNEEELDFLAEISGISGTLQRRLERISSRFAISMVALTRGESGSILFSESGFFESPGTNVPDLINTVGAGDAFAAALAAGVMQNAEPEQILERAGRMAAAVCRLSGAVPDRNDFYNAFVSKSGAKE